MAQLLAVHVGVQLAGLVEFSVVEQVEVLADSGGLELLRGLLEELGLPAPQ